MLRNIFAIALIPLSFAFLSSFIKSVEKLPADKGFTYFIAGCVAYVLLHIFLYKPLRLYILMHEITHVLSSILFGGKVKSISIKRNSGSVLLTRVNTFIAISPYFIPFLAILIMLVWFILKNISPEIEKNYNILVFLIGLSITFHIIMTMNALLKTQPDLKFAGTLYSLILIIAANSVIFITLLSILFPTKVSIIRYLDNVVYEAANNYSTIINIIKGIW